MAETFLNPDPLTCGYCGDKALYKGQDVTGRMIGACRDHRSQVKPVLLRPLPPAQAEGSWRTKGAVPNYRQRRRYRQRVGEL